jgi:hypothetical protein
VKVFRNVVCTMLLALCSFAQDGRLKLRVRDQKTAIRIGKAELIRRYGIRLMGSEGPISAKLEYGTWTVKTPPWCREMLPAQSFYCHGGPLCAHLQDRRTASCGGRLPRHGSVTMTLRVASKLNAGIL